MLVIDQSATDHGNSQAVCFDASLELLRELAVTNNVDAALPRLSAIVSKMLPHDALRMASFDQRGRPLVNASTADVPDMMASEVDEVIIDNLRAGALGASAAPHGTERLVGAGYRSVLACRRARRNPWCGWRSGRSGRWRSTARTCRSRVGSRTASASAPVAASSAGSPSDQ